MVDTNNYYEIDPESQDPSSPKRYPGNHVQFSPLLAPVNWIDRAYRLSGSQAFASKSAILREFDRAKPLDEILGTREELTQIRNLLERFGEGLDHNPFISPIGRYLIRKGTIDMLKLRTGVLRFYHANRDFIEANGRMKAPLIITGMARSGTTLLQRLISEDPNTRSPYTFEMECPLPPMTRERDPLRDPRIVKSGAVVNLISRVARGFLEKFTESHRWSSTEMEESFLYMMSHNGITPMNAMLAGTGYTDRFKTWEDKSTVIRYEQLFFRMLDAYRPARSHWTLKAPNYAAYFPLIFEAYPDARVVITHRNPLITLPSVCRLMESWLIAFDRDGVFDKYRFARFLEPFVEKCQTVPLDFRRDHPEREHQVFDCIYADLFTDPVRMVRRVYDRFGLEYTDEFERRMKIYMNNNRQGKYGRHCYSLQEYGLDPEQYCEKYRDYMETYGYDIPEEVVRPANLGEVAAG